MVKQKKTDRDKWYYAAKEQGFRSRAAFKLIQINKKFNFLGSARACLDLCAAPGGWSQVAAKYMPVSSIIIGVDLFPIKPIRNVITIKEDITTQKCRHEIKKNLKGWKVDVCLHDGAPNLGTAWAQDAYGQATLTLSAVGLAVDFLREGGTFVSKVFRSVDYNSILWVFNQLFKKVTVTKPPASRNTSAEIFVVCEGFLAPKQLDPRFLDPKHVFQALDAPAEKDLYFGQKRAKKNREGYGSDVSVLFKQDSVHAFVVSDNPTVVLANNHRLLFNDDESKKYLNHKATTPEIQACFEDIQVLGKKEIKSLLRWRLAIRRKFFASESDENTGAKASSTDDAEEKPELTEEQKEKMIDEELEEKLTRAQQKKRQKLKKERKKKAKQQRRKDLKMDLVGDSFDLQDPDSDLFQIAKIKTKAQLESFTAQKDAEVKDSDEENSEVEDSDDDPIDKFLHEEEYYNEQLEKVLDNQYEQFVEASTKIKKAILKKESKPMSDFDARAALKVADLQNKLDDATKTSIYDSDSDQEGNEKEEKNPLLVKVKEPQTKRAAQWFSQKLFEDEMEEDEDDDDSIDNSSAFNDSYEQTESVDNEASDEEEEEESQSTGAVAKSSAGKLEASEENDDFEVVPMENEDEDSDMDEWERAELLALGTLVKTGKLTLTDLVEEGYNRYSFNDDNLPTWFADEENKHNKPTLPVTKEDIRQILADNKGINARPIKKVAEAKARKKLKAKRKIEKVKSKATSIANDNELSEAAKSRQIEKLYKSQMAKMKTKQVYVVRRKFQKGLQRIGPKKEIGTKVRIVDKRMRKDRRAEKAAGKRSK